MKRIIGGIGHKKQSRMTPFLFYLLFKLIKFGRAEKLTERDIQSVTENFDSCY